jgi:ADP-ribosylglycohydrolase
MGGTTNNALHPLGKFEDMSREQYLPHYSFAKVVVANSDSQSNGCLMRITPLAVFTHRLLSDEELYTAVALQTMLTHSNKIAIDSCYLYCYAIRELI